MSAPVLLRQRADYTHKLNAKSGRHGWLRLTPAYSVKVVEELLDEFARPMKVFDPFCGTSTTALSAAYRGHESTTTDINPFLVWLGRAKTAHYTAAEIASTRRFCAEAVALSRDGVIEPAVPPPLHNIERWWPSRSLEFLCVMKAAIYQTTAAASVERTLLLIAFCRTLIGLSNASFSHQSMSFKDELQLSFDHEVDIHAMYVADVEFVLAGAADNPEGRATVLLCDSRSCSEKLQTQFDCVITSPPYVNRMSYIRELRPYMYWLDWLANGRDAGELDWLAIGGTWGIATSRLVEWKSLGSTFQSTGLDAALDQVAHADNKSGALLANYIRKYFDDMWSHFQGLTPVLGHHAQIHYIVGNSTFYGVLLPVESIYAEMLRELGFNDVACKAIRKRNSKKELIEFDVAAVWPH